MNSQQLNSKLDQKIRKVFFVASCSVLLFILYASLLPFNVSSASSFISFFDFLTTLTYPQGNSEQGEWIGHVIFNTLLTFLACHYCILSSRKRIWVQVLGFIFIFGILIEYLQMFIGSRGTSLADIYANIAGIMFGFIAWVIFGKLAKNSVSYFLKHQTIPIEYTKKIYLIFVVAVVLFPFDFFINSLQFQIAFATKGYPLFEMGRGTSIGMFSILAAFLLTFPLGFMYRISAMDDAKTNYKIIFKMGVLFFVLEVLQFFELSGQSSLPSLIAKITGFAAGFGIGRFVNLKKLLDICIEYRKILYLIAPVFIYLSLRVKGISFENSISMNNIKMIIDQMRFLPFLYYVDVSGGGALLSFLLNFVIFVPLGGLVAIHYLANDNSDDINFWRLTIVGSIAALFLEAVVLMWGLKRPDITNILVSAFAFPIGFYFMVMLKNGLDDRYSNEN